MNNGQIDFGYTGFVKQRPYKLDFGYDYYDLYAVTGGKVDCNYDGIFWTTIDGVPGWYGFVDGWLASDQALMKKDDGTWWYVGENGMVDFTYTGRAQTAYGEYYIRNGQIDFGYNGFATNDAGEVTKVVANGAVATTSMLFIFEAVGLGFFLKYTKFNKWVNTAFAIVLLVAAIVLGLQFPMYVSLGTWHIIIFVYILIASVAPVWALLQPRDYLNSYLLIFMIVGAVIGVFAANPACNLQAFTSFNVDGQYMFPILFVTIACGAVSGFHSLVSSGTASKQIKNEKNMLPVSFGAMLMESMLAIIALIAVASFGQGEAAAQGLTTQPQIFAGAIANFLSVIGLPHSLVFTLINLAVSAFALTSLDSVARVGRLSFQEFFLDSDTDEKNMSPFQKVVTNKYFATIITLVLAYLLTKVGYAEIWPLFGSANQLLSVLALVACAVFLKKTKRQGWMLWVPMVFMMAVTFTALGMTIVKLSKAFVTTGLDLGNSLQLIFAVLLLILGVLVAIQGIKKLLEKPETEKKAERA